MQCPIFFSNLFLVEQSNIEAGQGGRISHLSRCSPLPSCFLLDPGKGLVAAAPPPAFSGGCRRMLQWLRLAFAPCHIFAAHPKGCMGCPQSKLSNAERSPSILRIAGLHPAPTQPSAAPGRTNCRLCSPPGLGDRHCPHAQATHAAGLSICAQLKGFWGYPNRQPPASPCLVMPKFRACRWQR